MKLSFPLLATIFVSGCASVAVTSSSLEERTAFALSLNKENFTISNRKDSGIRTDYQVQTKAGALYNCYVTGAVGVTGRNVSDAICNPVASTTASEKGVSKQAEKKAEKKAPTTSNTSCNALLKAANKC